MCDFNHFYITIEVVICARIVVRYDYYQLNYYQPLVINSVPSSIPTKLVLRNSNKSFKPNNYKLPNATFLEKFMRNMIKQPIYKILYVQVIVAIVLGIALGHFFPDIGVIKTAW